MAGDEGTGILVLRGRPDDAETAALVVTLSLVLQRTPDATTSPLPAAGRAGWIRPPRYCPPGSWARHRKI